MKTLLALLLLAPALALGQASQQTTVSWNPVQTNIDGSLIQGQVAYAVAKCVEHPADPNNGACELNPPYLTLNSRGAWVLTSSCTNGQCADWEWDTTYDYSNTWTWYTAPYDNYCYVAWTQVLTQDMFGDDLPTIWSPAGNMECTRNDNSSFVATNGTVGTFSFSWPAFTGTVTIQGLEGGFDYEGFTQTYNGSAGTGNFTVGAGQIVVVFSTSPVQSGTPTYYLFNERNQATLTDPIVISGSGTSVKPAVSLSTH